VGELGPQIPTDQPKSFPAHLPLFLNSGRPCGTKLQSWIDYRKARTPLHYWRSTSGFEVDFLLDETVAVEVKATGLVQPNSGFALEGQTSTGLICGDHFVTRQGSIPLREIATSTAHLMYFTIVIKISNFGELGVKKKLPAG